MATSYTEPLGDPNSHISKRVKVLMRRAGTKRQELADSLKLHPASVTRSLSEDPEKRREWMVEDVVRLAVHFDINPALFFSEDKVFLEVVAEKYPELAPDENDPMVRLQRFAEEATPQP